MPGSSDNGSSSNGNQQAQSPNGETEAQPVRGIPDNASVPKPKRLACMICRKRKLKCDGIRPSCSTCSRLGHTCAYDEQRRKSGPKRGYVKALEERLKQVETLLKAQEPNGANASPTKSMGMPMATGPNPATSNGPNLTVNSGIGMGGDREMERWAVNGESPQTRNIEDFNFNSGMNMPMNNVGGDFTWEMIGLGLEEPLPPQETIDELHQVYFEKVHPSIPMIHKYRYLAAMNLAPSQRPPVCLRYAMWTMACSITDKFSDLKDLFYQRARKYVENDYIKGFGEHMISVAHCQTHILIANYEIRMLYFPRAWINTGSGVRLAQMLGLHRMDGEGLDVKQCLPPPRDWTEREERRRTFWMAFCQDRYASIGTGWPMVIDERDIMSDLPASEEAFEMSRPEPSQNLQDSTSPTGAAKLSSFGGIVLMASLFGRNLVHLHRPDADDLDDDMNGPFWKRHRQMDNILLNTTLCLPGHLKIPEGLPNPNVVFTNMSIHTSTICLHQAAIFKADKNKLPNSVSQESKTRCLNAAEQIASIMRTISHLDLSAMNPFISFCLYVSARVFVQYLKSRPEDSQKADSLRFLLSAMTALKRRNPLTESFLVQLDVDFEALAVRIPKLRNSFPRINDGAGIPIRGGSGNTNSPICDDPNGVQGIMQYRNQCHYLKADGDDGNLATGPEIVEPTLEAQSMRTSNSGTYNGQTWLAADQHMAGATPSTGSLYEKSGATSAALSGFGETNGDGQDTSGSPDGPQSTGRTPASNTSGSDARSRLATASMNGSGRNAFNNPLTAQQQSMLGHQTMDGTSSSFYPEPTPFVMSTEMGDQHPQQGQFDALGAGWGGMQGQGGIASVGDSIALRNLMNIAPMDAMDLASWDGANDNMR